jgi:hypothetical protein
MRPLATKAAPRPASNGMSAFAGLLTGLAGAYIIALVAYFVPLLTFLVAPFYGRFVADAVLSFAGDVRGRTIGAVGVGSILLGAFIALGTPFGASHVLSNSFANDISQATVGLAIGLSVIICYFRLKSSRP